MSVLDAGFVAAVMRGCQARITLAVWRTSSPFGSMRSSLVRSTRKRNASERAKARLFGRRFRDRLVLARPSALDALRDIAGIIDGAADLSTNKRHFASLGRRQIRRKP